MAKDRRPTAFAFFDFDHTIIDADAGPRFGQHLLRFERRRLTDGQGTLRSALRRMRLMARYTPFFAWMGIQAGMYQVGARRRSNIVRSAYRGLKGVPADVFRSQLAMFVQEELPGLVFPEIRKEMEGHVAAGRRCVVITTGMEPLVELALPLLPAGTDLIGCRLEERAGRLTGHVQGPLYGVDKANIIRAYCRAAGVDPAACWAYSDHWSDKEMLEAVGHPVAVHPHGKLLQRARKEGWTILEPAHVAG